MVQYNFKIRQVPIANRSIYRMQFNRFIFNRFLFNRLNQRIPQRVNVYTPKVHVCFSNKKKLAFVIGINYENDAKLKLNGCINDTKIIKNILMSDFGYTENDIILMTDNTDVKPTRKNIENTLNNILERVRKENITELFLSYSGHGTFVRDRDGDETDGQDEALVPLDCYTNGIILDDYLHSAFLSKLPANVNLFSLMDCCHSGTILDLQYKYVHRGGAATNGVFVTDQKKTVAAKVIKISGSRDNQVSMDAFLDGEFKGAMTASFSKTYKNSKDCRELLLNMSNNLKAQRFTQQPVLTSSFNYNDKDKILLK
jgi:hypothetical protein